MPEQAAVDKKVAFFDASIRVAKRGSTKFFKLSAPEIEAAKTERR